MWQLQDHFVWGSNKQPGMQKKQLWEHFWVFSYIQMQSSIQGIMYDEREEIIKRYLLSNI